MIGSVSPHDRCESRSSPVPCQGCILYSSEALSENFIFIVEKNKRTHLAVPPNHRNLNISILDIKFLEGSHLNSEGILNVKLVFSNVEGQYRDRYPSDLPP